MDQCEAYSFQPVGQWMSNSFTDLGAEGFCRSLNALLPLGFSGRRGIVVACVCPFVRPSVRKLYPVRTITRHTFELESPNLLQTCIMGYSLLVLMKIGVTDLDLQGHFGHFDSEFLEIQLVRAITHHRFGLESPNLQQTYTLGYSPLVLKMEVIDHDLQGHFGHFDSELLEIWLVRVITRHRYGLESPKFHQINILGLSQVVLKMEGIDLDLQCNLAFSSHNAVFNVTFVHWSRPAKGCYPSQTC